MKVVDVYARVCSRFLEPYPPGLKSGIFTVDDFLAHFDGAVSDFFENSGIVQIIITGAIHIGIPAYQIPDQMSHVTNMFVAGRLLRRTNLQDLDNGVYQWRRRNGVPEAYHEDGLPIKQVEVYKTPAYEGQAIPTSGPGVITPPETDEFMIVGDFFPSWRDYTLVGTQVPLNADFTVKQDWALDDEILWLPNSAVPYLAWGVLEKMFSDDSEAKDQARARYCSARFQEGISVFRTILAERLFQEPDGAL